ncbi:hypothetical protein DOY81_007392 [Sarcophaga bullata]|nr:hypothetical protein DOY81_007392 [Sarcophaga bullata]
MSAENHLSAEAVTGLSEEEQLKKHQSQLEILKLKQQSRALESELVEIVCVVDDENKIDIL